MRRIMRVYHRFPTYAVQVSVFCGSTAAENRRKPQIYRETREDRLYWLQSIRKPSATFRETTGS